MKLPNIPFLQKKEKPEYILSLVLRNEKANAFIFEKVSGQISVISESEEYFENSIETATLEELLDVCDKAISQAEESLPQNLEVQKTIFGLKETWILDNKIKKEHLLKLKKISSDLGLSPIGFLTIPEAIVNFIQKEEGAPPSAILADIGKKYVTVSLVRAGRIIESKTSEIHESPSFTVDTLLKHFEAPEILPSRVIILNGEEDLAQEFITHQWSKSLPFLHLPQTINLPENFLGRAFIYGVANRMGAMVKEDFEDKEALEIEQITEAPVEETSKVKYLGGAAEYFGFLEEKDVSKIKPPEPEIAVEPAQEEAVTEEIPEEVKEETEGRQILPAGAMLLLAKVLNFLSNAFELLKKSVSKLPAIKNLPIKNKGVLFLLAPLLILILLLLYYFLGLQAKVVIKVDPKIVEKSQDITFSTASDFSNNVIKGKFISVTKDGSTSGNATGKKETGDKAKGTVTIFNSTDTTVTFPSQAKLVSSNNLIFLTLDKATVASQSGDVFSSKTPGKTNVNVEASTFGTEYNLPSATKFTIGTNPLIAAKNDNPFSGGTKKDITVFSKDDAQKLRDDLIKSLEEKAKADLQNKLQANQSILPNFVDETLDKEDFDKDVDAEAKTVTLKGTVSYESLSYDKKEFQDYLKTVFGTDVDAKNVELSFENIKVKGNDVSAKLKVKAKIFPALSIDDLSKKIAGKSFTEAENQIMSVPQVADVRINFSPNLFFFPKNLPRINKNIKIVIK